MASWERDLNELADDFAELADNPNAGELEEASTSQDSDDDEANAKSFKTKKTKKTKKPHHRTRKCKRWIHAGIFRDSRSEKQQIWYGFNREYREDLEKYIWVLCHAGDKHGRPLGNRGAGRGKQFMITYNKYLEAAWEEYLDADGAFAHGCVTVGRHEQRGSLLKNWKNRKFVDRYPDGNESLMFGPDINVIRRPDDFDENGDRIPYPSPIRPEDQHSNCYLNTRIPLSTRKIKIGLYIRWNMDALTVVEDFLMGRMAVTANANVPGYESVQADRIESAFFHLGWRADWRAIRTANKHVRQKDVALAVNSGTWISHPPIQIDRLQRNSNEVRQLMRRIRDANPEVHDQQDGEDSSNDEDDFRGAGNDDSDSDSDDDDDDDDEDVQVVSSRRRKSSRKNKNKNKSKAKKRSKRKGGKLNKKGKKPKKKAVARPKRSATLFVESSDDENGSLPIINEFVDDGDDRPGMLPESDSDSESNSEAGRMLAALKQQLNFRPSIKFEENEVHEAGNIDENFGDEENDFDFDFDGYINESPEPERSINLSGTKYAYLKSQASKPPFTGVSQPRHETIQSDPTQKEEIVEWESMTLRSRSPDASQRSLRLLEIEKTKSEMRALLLNHPFAQSSQTAEEGEASYHAQVSSMIGQRSPNFHVNDEGDVVMKTSDSENGISEAALSSSRSPPALNLLALVQGSYQKSPGMKSEMSAGNDEMDELISFRTPTSYETPLIGDSSPEIAHFTRNSPQKKRSEEHTDDGGSPAKKIKTEGLAFLIKYEPGLTIDLSDSENEGDETMISRGRVLPYSPTDPMEVDGSGKGDDPYLNY